MTGESESIETLVSITLTSISKQCLKYDTLIETEKNSDEIKVNPAGSMKKID